MAFRKIQSCANLCSSTTCIMAVETKWLRVTMNCVEFCSIGLSIPDGRGMLLEARIEMPFTLDLMAGPGTAVGIG